MYTQRGSLAALFDSKTVAPIARAIADDAGRSFTRHAAEATPRLTGRTAESWQHVGVEGVRHESGLPAWQSGTLNSYYKARWLEFGVKPHGLGDGERQGAQHPGTAGHHMTSKAAELVEAELPAIAHPKLAGWAAGLEARANAGGRAKP